MVDHLKARLPKVTVRQKGPTQDGSDFAQTVEQIEALRSVIWNECQPYTTDIIYFTLRLTLSEMVLSIAGQAQERPADLLEQLRKEMQSDIDKLIAAKS